MIGKPLNNTDDDKGRDWLFVETSARQVGDLAGGIGDDIYTLYHFLRGKPTATKEVREAIVRILRNGWDTLGRGKTLISMLFDPAQTTKEFGAPVWTVDFKKTSKGHANPYRDFEVAIAIQACRDCGKSYDEAIEWAVENFGIGDRRAKQIYGKAKDKITKLRVRSVKSDS